MAKECPKCGNNTLDYKASFNLWKCVRADCDYQKRKEKDEINSHIISVFD